MVAAGRARMRQQGHPPQPPPPQEERIYHLLTTETKDCLETYEFCLTGFIGDFVSVHRSAVRQSVAQLLRTLTFSYNLLCFLLALFLLYAK